MSKSQVQQDILSRLSMTLPHHLSALMIQLIDNPSFTSLDASTQALLQIRNPCYYRENPSQMLVSRENELFSVTVSSALVYPFPFVTAEKNTW